MVQELDNEDDEEDCDGPCKPNKFSRPMKNNRVRILYTSNNAYASNYNSRNVGFSFKLDQKRAETTVEQETYKTL